MASEGLHEERSALGAETVDHHRAIVSLMEELEAIDWYDQRVDAATDDGLREILAHNRDEEKEHAAMTLEWIRRRDPVFDQMLRTYLFTDGPITGIEDATGNGADDDGDRRHDASLRIGSLKGAGL